MTSLNGWHPGERSMHQKLGTTNKVTMDYTMIQGDLPPEHAKFYEVCLPFIPVTTLDDLGRPWGSILAGKNGEKGFVRNRQYTRLDVNAQLWDGDPLERNLLHFNEDKEILIAGIGVEFSTRRRNKFAGSISKLKKSNHDIEMELFVNEAIGNCVKYINLRDLEPQPNRLPEVIYNQPSFTAEETLPDEVVRFIVSSDTVFIGTSYVAKPEMAEKYPSHVGMNHRGGRVGFVRVRKDGRTVVLPDYSGNRLMTSLGNIESTPLASLTFADFATGDILYLTGEARNIVGPEAHDLMPFQNSLTLVHPTGFVFVRDALPVQQKSGTLHHVSPYSPPVRLLAEEGPMGLFQIDDRPEVVLTKITPHEGQIATFTWETSKEIMIHPGQAIILDCSLLLGARQYQHLCPLNPTSVNDDRIRTWTVSSSSTKPTRSFSITLRYRPGGALTTAFFSITEKLVAFRKELLSDTRPLGLTLKIAGVTGRFTFPPPSPALHGARKLVWFAGGIGVTPFLSLLKSIRETMTDEQADIRLIISTREPHVLLPLVFKAYSENEIKSELGATATLCPRVKLEVDVFNSKGHQTLETGVPSGIVLREHAQRVEAAFIEAQMADIIGKDIYVCGPNEYTRIIHKTLVNIGVASGRIQTEDFFY